MPAPMNVGTSQRVAQSRAEKRRRSRGSAGSRRRK